MMWQQNGEMMKKYNVFIEPSAHKQRKQLPGHVRQRIKQAIDNLDQYPRPYQSKPLDTTDLDIPETIELHRIRIENWRIIYAINDFDNWVWVLAIRKRPPYDYEDLVELVRKTST